MPAAKRQRRSRQQKPFTLSASEDVETLAWSPDGRLLAVGAGHWLYVYDPVSAAPLNTWQILHDVPIESWGVMDRLKAWWDNNTLPTTYPNHITTIAWDPDGTRIAVGGKGVVRILEAATGRELLDIPASVYDSNVLAFSPKGESLASAHEYSKFVGLWDTTTINCLLLVDHGGIIPDQILAVSFPSGHLLTADRKIIRTWDISTGGQLTRVELSDPCSDWAGALSLDGGKFAIGSNDKARVWDIRTGEKCITVQHQGEVRAVALNADGSRLATGSRDCTSRVWDCSTGQQLMEVKPGGRVSRVAISPEGTWLATASSKVVRIWPLSNGETEVY